jgi:hypothetical protein
MGHGCGCFPQEQAVFGSCGEDSATAAFRNNCGMISRRIVAEDAELEAILTGRFAMATAGIAAGTGEQRENVMAEGNWLWGDGT